MTSQSTAPAAPLPPTTYQLCPSRDELAELERELDLYLTFWTCARDLRPSGAEGAIR